VGLLPHHLLFLSHNWQELLLILLGFSISNHLQLAAILRFPQPRVPYLHQLRLRIFLIGAPTEHLLRDTHLSIIVVSIDVIVITSGFEVISVAGDTLLKQIKDNEVQLSTEIDAQLLKNFKNDALGVILKELIHESGYIF
jgi:hypothetical protein